MTTTNTTNRKPLMIDTYRYGLVSRDELQTLREADEAKAKAKVVRTGEPVTIRVNLGIYEMFTTAGKFQIEKELDHGTEEPTGWWTVYEYINDWPSEIGVYFQTLRDAKAHVAAI